MTLILSLTIPWLTNQLTKDTTVPCYKPTQHLEKYTVGFNYQNYNLQIPLCKCCAIACVADKLAKIRTISVRSAHEYRIIQVPIF